MVPPPLLRVWIKLSLFCCGWRKGEYNTMNQKDDQICGKDSSIIVAAFRLKLPILRSQNFAYQQKWQFSVSKIPYNRNGQKVNQNLLVSGWSVADWQGSLASSCSTKTTTVWLFPPKSDCWNELTFVWKNCELSLGPLLKTEHAQRHSCFFNSNCIPFAPVKTEVCPPLLYSPPPPLIECYH